MSLWTRLSELVFIPWCAACDARVGRDRPLCDTCAISLVPLGPACPLCAEPMAGPHSLRCRRCVASPPPFAAVLAPFRYGGELATALRRLKYQNRPDVGRSLAPLIGPMLRAAAAECDVIIPLPLHRRRLAERGFNQSALLARYASHGVSTPLDQRSLRRIRATAPQSGLTGGARTTNVAGAFAVPARRRERIADRTILLVDDVMTTGATMRAAATALHQAGAAAVVGFCVARAES